MSKYLAPLVLHIVLTAIGAAIGVNIYFLQATLVCGH